MPEKITDALLLLFERPLCAGCIASEVAVAELDIDPLLARIHDTVYVGQSSDQCSGCGKTRLIYSLDRTG